MHKFESIHLILFYYKFEGLYVIYQ